MVEKEERSNMNKHCVQSHKKVPSVTNQGEKKKKTKNLCLGILQESLKSHLCPYQIVKSENNQPMPRFCYNVI